MNPSRLFILRPVATTLLMLALFLSGLLAYRLLPVSALPQVDYPTVQVVTLYPGAAADLMASSVTAPLERQLGQIPGLSRMSSRSSEGASVITLQFALDRVLDIAIQDVQSAMNAANNLLPSDLPMPPIYNKVNPADAPILSLAIVSKGLPLAQVQDRVETQIAQKIAQVSGVGLVSLAGGNRPAIRIQADPRKLANMGLTLEDLRARIVASSTKQPKGSFDGARQASTIDSNDQLNSAAEFESLVIKSNQDVIGGGVLRLSDIATVKEGVENTRLAAWTNTQAAIIMNIQRQPGANVIETVSRIEQLLPALRQSLGDGIQIITLSDRTYSIRASIHDVQFEMMLAIALVVMVMFCFLRNLPATIIPSVTIPLSLVGTLGVMYLAGFSLNNLTLMALTIATGFVVDDAIVMIENISRYLEEGDSPLEAALKGSQQIGFTVISLTFSLLAVLIPLLFMGEGVGRLFREFTLTLAVAIILSAVISLTLTPMMCAYFLKPLHAVKEHAHNGSTQPTYLRVYGKILSWVLNHRKLTLLISSLTVLLTVLMYIFIPKGFFPQQDTGLIQGISEAAPDSSFAAMVEKQKNVLAMIKRDPAVEHVSAFIGVDGSNATLNTGRLSITLKEHNERYKKGDTAPVVIQRLEQMAKKELPGVSLALQSVQDLTLEDGMGRAQYQWVMDAPDATLLNQAVPRVLSALQRLPILKDVVAEGQAKGRQYFIEIDRVRASQLGVTAAAVSNALYNAFGQRLVSTLFTQSNQYRVVLEVNGQYQYGREALDHVFVASSAGVPVPLSAMTTVREQSVPLVIDRLGQFPAVTFSFNLAKDVSLSHAVEAIDAMKQELALPESIQTHFQGAALAFRASLKNTPFLMCAAVLTMYIVLGMLYENYIHPITILSTLPSAGLGALLALMLKGKDLSVMAIIGIVLLIGIVKKNGIMMVDFALEAERERGLSPQDAVFEACMVRFRPILMTTLAALLGALPMMLGTGVGSELRQPLGITMVGGLLLSQVLTIFTTPVLYLSFHRLQK